VKQGLQKNELTGRAENRFMDVIGMVNGGKLTKRRSKSNSSRKFSGSAPLRILAEKRRRGIDEA
jgi:hypothetical protein